MKPLNLLVGRLSGGLSAPNAVPSLRMSPNHSNTIGPSAGRALASRAVALPGLVFVWRNERLLEEKAEKALPGPLEAY